MVTLRNDCKSGETFLNRRSIRPLLDRDGRVIDYLGVQYDLSERRGGESDRVSFS